MSNGIPPLLAELRHRVALLKAAIAILEQLVPDPAPFTQKRRGRKFMAAEERKQVSERMRQYWAGRRKGASHA